MSESEKMTVVARDGAGKGAARATRRAGLVPGVVYGAKLPPTLIAVDPRRLSNEMHRSGFSPACFILNWMARSIVFFAVPCSGIR